ncbi:MAG: DNA topoisomerase III [Bacteriovoracaceae bacterium]|nr:DNA topoisomerase III [Bacteriovoracaceae bacterium]
MKTLILTEKPSVAFDFAKALDLGMRGEGFIEGDKYLVTWAVGHLLHPVDPHGYDLSYKKWSLKSLPIIPKKFKYGSDPKTKKQLKIVTSLMGRSDLDTLIVATDAGREGELIAREIIEHAKKAPKKRFRFWTSQALTPSVINEQMSNLKNLSNYDRLYYAGRSRQHADWLVGMNFSRLATLKMGDLFSVGRVQTAILALLVKRRLEREAFIEETYYLIKAKFNFPKNKNLEATWYDPLKRAGETHLESEKMVGLICASIEGKDASVSEIEEKQVCYPPPLLYSLTELQREANRIYGYTAKKTLTLAQELYERHKAISYPRTDSQYLGSKNFSMITSLLEKFKNTRADLFKEISPKKVTKFNRRIFNDSKLTDHHALIPLKLFKGRGDSDAGKIYFLILRRFAMAFMADHKFMQTSVKLKVESEHFKSSGKMITQVGWKALLSHESDQLLPLLEKGEMGKCVEPRAEEKQTLPPPDYNDSSLLKEMTNPARLVDEEELKKVFRTQIGLGTQSTRAQIIETLIQRKYVKREKKSIIALEKGITLIRTLSTLKNSKILISAKETARWELSLEQMAQGDLEEKIFMDEIIDFIIKSTSEWKGADIAYIPKKERTGERSSSNFGTCPLCQSTLFTHTKFIGCSSWKEGCKFKLWRRVASKSLSDSTLQSLIGSGKTRFLKGFKSKSGKSFSAMLTMDKNGVVSMKFKNRSTSS